MNERIFYGWRGRVYRVFVHTPDTKPIERRKAFKPSSVCHMFCLEMQRHTMECVERQALSAQLADRGYRLVNKETK